MYIVSFLDLTQKRLLKVLELSQQSLYCCLNSAMQNTITNSIYTKIQMDIVVYGELALNVGFERIWFSEIRVGF